MPRRKRLHGYWVELDEQDKDTLEKDHPETPRSSMRAFVELGRARPASMGPRTNNCIKYPLLFIPSIWAGSQREVLALAKLQNVRWFVDDTVMFAPAVWLIQMYPERTSLPRMVRAWEKLWERRKEEERSAFLGLGKDTKMQKRGER